MEEKWLADLATAPVDASWSAARPPRVFGTFCEGIISYIPHANHTTSWFPFFLLSFFLSILVLVLHNTRQPCFSS